MASNNIKLTVTQTETRPDGSSTATTATVEIPLGQAEVAAPAIEDAKPNYIITTDAITVPDVGIADFVLGKASAFGDAVAMVDGPTGRELTFNQIAKMARAVAAGMAQRGLKKGDVFAIISPNLPEYAIAFHAAALIGVVVTPINPLYTPKDIAHQLKDSGATMLLTINMFLEKAQGAIEHGAPVTQVFTFDAKEESTITANGKSVKVEPFAALGANGDAGFPDVTVSKDDTLCIPYSSGTSGLPKGVVLTHGNLVANLLQLTHKGEFINMDHTDVLVGVLPFFHIYGLVVLMNLSLMLGCKLVTMPKFDPGLFLKILKGHGVTVAHVAPPLVNFLAKHPVIDTVLPLPKLKELFSGAAPLGPELIEAVCKRLNIKEVRQGYGMTEMSPASHVVPYNDTHLGSIGKLIAGMQAKIVSTETGEIVGPGERGELCCKGPNIMKGYLNKPEETAKCMDADGYLHTGDVAIVDENGIFSIVDRVKELIKVKGFQVPPAELEAVIGGFEKVADVAVIGIPDERAGELPKAFVVKQKGAEDMTEQDVMDYVNAKVAPYKKVAVVEFVATIPKSAAGKILRKELRAAEKAKASN